MADFKFKIVGGQRVNAVGTIFKFDVRMPGMTLHNLRLVTGKNDKSKRYGDIHLDHPKGTKGSEAFGATFPEYVGEMIRLGAIVALADWTAKNGQQYPPELVTTSERMAWLVEWRESTRISAAAYIEVTEGLNELEDVTVQGDGHE